MIGSKISNINLNNKISSNSNDKLYNSQSNILTLFQIFILLMILLYIEYKRPYFFLQDDNRDYFLPYFIHNYESLLGGEIPLYNFHQFLGIPSLAVGQTGALYPLNYIAVFISKSFFGHYFAAIDIQVIIHLLIGAVGINKFVEFFNIKQKIAVFAGMTWPLSSFIIYASNSWIVVAPVAAYFPWMLLYSFRLYKSRKTKEIFVSLSVRLMFFYAGHIQYFLYSVIFEFITVILYVITNSEIGEKKSNTIKYIKSYIIQYIYIFILSLPLLLPMWHHTSISANRSMRLPFSVFVSQYFPVDQLIKGLFFPFMQVDENIYASFRNLLNLSHIGYITTTLLIIAIIDRYIKRVFDIKIITVKISVFVVPSIIAFLWTTNWLFNYIIYQIPILNRFRWPFKIVLYLDFYLILIATMVLYSIIKWIPVKDITKNIIILVIIIIQIVNFLFIYTVIPYKDFGEHHSDNLPLIENLKDKLSDGRVISIGFDTWTPSSENNKGYLTAPTLGFNYATLWGLDYFAGYEPLIPKSNSDASLNINFTGIIQSIDNTTLEHLRKSAVKWYIVPIYKAEEYSKIFIRYGILPKYEDENRVVFYDANAYPMVYRTNENKLDGVDYNVKTNSIVLNVELKEPNNIIFNNLYNQYFVGFIDGKKAKLTPINGIHFSILVPEGNHNVLIIYKDPYFILGLYISLIFLITYISKYIFKIYLKKNMEVLLWTKFQLLYLAIMSRKF